MIIVKVSINKADLANLIRSSRTLAVKSLAEVWEQLGNQQVTVDPHEEKEEVGGVAILRDGEEVVYLDQDNQIISKVEVVEEDIPFLAPQKIEIQPPSRREQLSEVVTPRPTVPLCSGPQFRKKQSMVWNFFTKTADGSKVICKCGEVQRFMSNTTNMIRHIQRSHSTGRTDSPKIQSDAGGDRRSSLRTPGRSVRRKTVHRSPVWEHFSRVTGEARVQCQICSELYTFSGNTTNLRFHLRTRHPEVHDKLADGIALTRPETESKEVKEDTVEVQKSCGEINLQVCEVNEVFVDSSTMDLE